MADKIGFRRFGILLDNSRNAVMKPSAVKRMIDIISKMGYNSIMLYTEDTYEVDNQTYFGHLRGRYTKEELKEINFYAAENGIELIPCIQTLAHLNAIMRWKCYNKIRDCYDILCVGEEGTYKLIEDMFSTIAECFTSKIVNIGMDEAQLLGRGSYINKNGYENQYDIFIKHLNRVADIAKKHGLELCIWSDMFYSMVSGGDYYSEDAEIPSEIKQQIPENVHLIYWDYYSSDKQHYDSYIKRHKKLSENIMFAGGAWTWAGFAPHNYFSIEAASAAIKSCRENNVEDVFLTMWGDDGAECSAFSVLPTLFAASEFAKGNTDSDAISEKFEEMFGIKFNDFLLLDMPDTPNTKTSVTYPKNVKHPVANPDKYMFYNDCFMGLFDGNIKEGDGQAYGDCAKKLEPMRANKDFGLIFDSIYYLCRVLEIKADIGLKTRNAYLNKDKEGIKSLISQYDLLLLRLDEFYQAHLRRWNSENKPHGFDVQDIRLGGLIQRIKHCKNVLSEYVDNRIETIAELEEPVLDIHCAGENLQKDTIYYNSWNSTVTANVL